MICKSEHCCAVDVDNPCKGQQPDAADYEVAEHLMRWLGTSHGQKFIGKCQRKIKFLQDEERYDQET